MYVHTRVETGSGHSGHLGHLGQILSGLSGSHPLYKISKFCIGSRALIMASGRDQSDEFSMLDSNDGSVYPQDISKTGHCW